MAATRLLAYRVQSPQEREAMLALDVSTDVRQTGGVEDRYLGVAGSDVGLVLVSAPFSMCTWFYQMRLFDGRFVLDVFFY